MSEPIVIDLDVNALESRDLARMLISRSYSTDSLVWAELGWDIRRYQRVDHLVAALLGIIQQLLDEVGAHSDLPGVEVWRGLLLAEARDGGSP